MYRLLYILFLIATFFFAGLQLSAQEFIVDRMPFSTRLNDEFSPVIYKGGLVFCSNMRDNSLVGFNDQGNNLFKLFYVAGNNSSGWNHPVLLARELTSGYNDGPVTFNSAGDVMYFSRNNVIEKSLKNISDTTNKMGIYKATLEKGEWTSIMPASFNNPLYSYLTPSLSPEGDRIYFASDMPGGFGGMDLYYCNWINGNWGKPENLGPVVNTPGNELFPFASVYGKLYFSSDGHKGLGGKDLYYTQEIRGLWIIPGHFDSGMNSPADDFGLVMDTTLKAGYFSSRRLKSDDIFRFSTPPLEFTGCDSIRENNYCFILYDEKHLQIDTIPVTYTWDFGNGILRHGTEVKHCFPGPGKYTVALTITDDLTGDTISEETTYDVDLEDIEQVYISSADVSLVDRSVVIDSEYNLKDFKATDYFWDLGDGFRPGGPTMSKVFRKSGVYEIRLGMLGQKDTLDSAPKRCFMKKIRIYSSSREMVPEGIATTTGISDSLETERRDLPIRIHFMDDLQERQRSRIRSMITIPEDAAISFYKNGLSPRSHSDLDNIIDVLKANPDIRLGVAVQGMQESIQPGVMNFSEKCSREINYYFRQKDPGLPVWCKGIGYSSLILKNYPDKEKVDGLIEFIFMKK